MRAWDTVLLEGALGGAHADAAGALTEGGRSGGRRRGRDNGDRVGADPRAAGVCECAAIGRRGHCRRAKHTMP